MLTGTVAFQPFVSEASPVAKGMSVRDGTKHEKLFAAQADDRARQPRLRRSVGLDQCEALIEELDLHAKPHIERHGSAVNKRMNR
jgi:hypothetical protein